nr:immunoglobulin light chain junction region [Macaca mulatta]
CQQYNNSPYSV